MGGRFECGDVHFLPSYVAYVRYITQLWFSAQMKPSLTDVLCLTMNDNKLKAFARIKRVFSLNLDF